MNKIISFVKAVTFLFLAPTVSFSQSNQSIRDNALQPVELNPYIDLVEIYPNPASEYLNIEQQYFDGNISQLEIIDLAGHSVYKINEKFTQLSIYVGNWKKGLYMVFFKKGEHEVVHKIVVQ
ncbi:MAG: T9SS type A sorting domain-containing protein [Reichenbachiella sp.]|uniref:T9SS type A sorting domain-containing protein n=1 Tax=Reichenbachiella sp. TaxID=2184521 RepID=UPI0032675683